MNDTPNRQQGGLSDEQIELLRGLPKDVPVESTEADARVAETEADNGN